MAWVRVARGGLYVKTSDTVVYGEYELLDDTTVSVDTSQVNITGLSIDPVDEILIVFNQPSTASGSTYLCVNSNTTLSNYYYQRLLCSGATVSGTRQNVPVFSISGEGGLTIADVNITGSGYVVYQAHENDDFDISPRLFEHYGTSTFTVSSITEFNFIAQNTDGIKEDTRIQIYRKGES